MRIIIISSLLLLITSCSYKIAKNYKTTGNYQIIQDVQPLLVKHKNLYGLKAKYLGTIKLDDSGFTINCSEDKAIEKLNSEAGRLNSNLINITEEVYPGYSTCYRCVANFYKIDFDSIAIDILKKPKRMTIKYDSIDKIKWTDFKIPLSDSSIVPYLFYSNIELESKGASFWDGTYKNFRAQGVFYCDVSMVKTSFVSDSNLIQVQLQYDLTQLYAKRLEQYLNSDSFRSGNRVKVQNVLDRYFNDLLLEQKKCLDETEYGNNRIAQQNWREKVSRELRKIDIIK